MRILRRPLGLSCFDGVVRELISRGDAIAKYLGLRAIESVQRGRIGRKDQAQGVCGSWVKPFW
jgi:hypothetical protein